jgi:hypothetical protein
VTTLTVTAAQAGSPSNGMGLRVMVITGALAVASQTGGKTGTQTGSGGSNVTVSVTTTQTGSRVYGACSPFTGSVSSAAAANTTIIDNFLDATNTDNYVTFKGTSTTGTPGATTFGVTNTANAGAAGPAAYEVLVSTTLAEDGSGPGFASTTTAQTVTTASFTPPGSSLLVALIASNGSTGSETMTVTDNLGVHLNWTEKIRNTAGAGNDYAGVWVADVPSSGAAPLVAGMLSTALVTPGRWGWRNAGHSR